MLSNVPEKMYTDLTRSKSVDRNISYSRYKKLLLTMCSLKYYVMICSNIHGTSTNHIGISQFGHSKYVILLRSLNDKVFECMSGFPS